MFMSETVNFGTKSVVQRKPGRRAAEKATEKAAEKATEKRKRSRFARRSCDARATRERIGAGMIIGEMIGR